MNRLYVRQRVKVYGDPIMGRALEGYAIIEEITHHDDVGDGLVLALVTFDYVVDPFRQYLTEYVVNRCLNANNASF